MLHAMSFDEIVGNNMVILGSGETDDGDRFRGYITRAPS